MKSVNNRQRAKKGRTDYYHRKRLLTQYQNYTRVRFGKKLNYYYVGLYQTEDPSRPDRCLFYAESRWIRCNGQTVHTNLNTSFEFSRLCALKFNELNLERDLILDLSRRKRIQYKPFLFGLLQNLSPQLRQRFHHGFTQSQVSEFRPSPSEDGVQRTYHFHDSSTV